MSENTPAPAEAAGLYAAAGWPVLPLHDTAAGVCSCDDGPSCRVAGKHPRLRHGHRDASTDRGKVHAWWDRWRHANIGVATGRASGLLVVDLDGADGATAWHAIETEHGATATATAITPHGRHLWYRTPAGLAVPRRIRALAQGVDVLGDGGYAIAPPSHTLTRDPDGEPGGGRYTWTAPRAGLAPLPAWIAHLASSPTPADADSATSSDATTPGAVADAMRRAPDRRYGQVALHGEAARVAAAQPGARNNTLNAAAYRLGRLVGGGELDRTDAEHALTEAAEAAGLSDDDGYAQVQRTIRSGLDAGAANPRTRPPRRTLPHP